jgi:Domain of unknown function (DUF4465)
MYFKQLISAVSFLISIQSFAQNISGFENVVLNPNGFNNGSDTSGGFTSGEIRFVNQYNTEFSFWTGFAASQLTDTVTSGFSNQYSSYAGSAFEGNKFGIVYASSSVFMRNDEPSTSKRLRSFRFTNNTYAALSMKNGDAFSKKFGGISGNDPDFFLLSVYNYSGGIITDSASWYLSDYRSANNADDYIVKSWRLAEPNFSNQFDSISFRLSSSDNGSFGMNTPSYFCIDKIETEIQTGIQKTVEDAHTCFLNPVSDKLFLSYGEKLQSYEIFQLDGKKVKSGKYDQKGKTGIDLKNLPCGIYQIVGDDLSYYRFIKL